MKPGLTPVEPDGAAPWEEDVSGAPPQLTLGLTSGASSEDC